MAIGRKTSQLEHGVPSTEDYFDYVDVSETVPALKDKTSLISTLIALIGGGGGGGTYTNLNPTPDQTGHVEAGTTFDGVALTDVFDMLFYSLMATFSAQNTPRRLGSSNAVTLNWSVTRAGDPITQIIVAGQDIVETGDSQSGTVSTTATQNVDTSFAMSVTDGANIVNKTTIVQWLNDRFWGSLNLTGAGTVASSITDLVNSPPTDAQIKSLLSRELSGTRAQSRNGINAAGNFLAFAWPTSFGTPTFIVNGLTNTAFTKVRSASAFVNADGYTANYDVWMSNTRYNSPVGQFQII